MRGVFVRPRLPESRARLRGGAFPHPRTTACAAMRDWIEHFLSRIQGVAPANRCFKSCGTRLLEKANEPFFFLPYGGVS